MSRPIDISVVVRWQPKQGAPDSEYEDAFCNNSPSFAIADGASEGYLSGPWARHLVNAFAENHVVPVPELLCEAAEGWVDIVRQYVKDRNQRGNPLKWFEQPKAAAGAYATLLAVTFESSQVRHCGKWTAIAVGDSCIFRVRRGRLNLKWPLRASADFGLTPRLICSRQDQLSMTRQAFISQRGVWLPGDSYYLMTDAIANWFLGMHERASRPWLELDALLELEPHEFRTWVGSQRVDRTMRDDDVTVVRLRTQ